MKLKLDSKISELLTLVCVYDYTTVVQTDKWPLCIVYRWGCQTAIWPDHPVLWYKVRLTISLKTRQAKVQCSFQHHLISSMRQQLATLNKILVITAGFWVQNAPKLFAFGPSSAPDPTGGAKTSPGLVIWGRDTPHSPPHQCIRHLYVRSRFLTILSILSILQQSYVQCPLTVLMYCVKRLR